MSSAIPDNNEQSLFSVFTAHRWGPVAFTADVEDKDRGLSEREEDSACKEGPRESGEKW